MCSRNAGNMGSHCRVLRRVAKYNFCFKWITLGDILRKKGQEERLTCQEVTI